MNITLMSKTETYAVNYDSRVYVVQKTMTTYNNKEEYKVFNEEGLEVKNTKKIEMVFKLKNKIRTEGNEKWLIQLITLLIVC